MRVSGCSTRSPFSRHQRKGSAFRVGTMMPSRPKLSVSAIRAWQVQVRLSHRVPEVTERRDVARNLTLPLHHTSGTLADGIAQFARPVIPVHALADPARTLQIPHRRRAYRATIDSKLQGRARNRRIEKTAMSAADRGLSFRGSLARTPIDRLCQDLVSERGEASGTAIAREIAERYAVLGRRERLSFLRSLLEPKWPADPEEILRSASAYHARPTALHATELS